MTPEDRALATEELKARTVLLSTLRQRVQHEEAVIKALQSRLEG